MKRALPQLQDLSESIQSHYTYYSFAKEDTNLSERYKKGRVKASKWLSDLIYYYFKKENSFIYEFKEHIQEQKIKLSELEDDDFKQGLFDELNIIEDMLDKRIKKINPN